MKAKYIILISYMNDYKANSVLIFVANIYIMPGTILF